MMERLKKSPPPADPKLAHAARLVQSARLPEPSEERKARVRAAIRGRQERLRGRLILRPAFAAAVLLLASAAAASVTWVVAKWVRSPEPPAPPPAETPRKPAKRALPRSLELPAVSPDEAPPEDLPLLPPEEPVAPKRPKARPVKAHKPAAPEPLPSPVIARAPLPLPEPAAAPDPEPSPAPRPPPPPPPDAEVQLVQSAFGALRLERNPGRAAALLGEYLRRFPRGKLLEEALGLAIEAAAVRGDKSASSLAERYLQSFPKGRFRGAAEAARARFRK
jgi:hypothetical protein